jgi:signal transduction histidine kinase
MINDLLDISKLESGGMALEYSSVVPREVAAEALRQVAGLGQDKEIQLVLRVEDDRPFTADAAKVCRILVNLLGNAVKFTPVGGQITLTVQPEPDGGSLRFSVQDTGEGIPEAAFEKIFEKFGQVESRKAGRKLSTGLGLAFCKMAVEAHGGRIWVESRLGHGSTFSFTLPRAAPRRGPATPA